MITVAAIRMEQFGVQFYQASLTARDVGKLVRFYKAQPQDLMLVLDDMALPPGRIRLRPGGSAGGHNGLADVLAAMGTDEVPRLRIGIGEPPGPMDGVDYVLGRLSEDELAAAKGAIERACQAIEDWLSTDLSAVMSQYNQNEKSQ